MSAFLAAVGLVLVAELGDKTQLVVLAWGRLTPRVTAGLAAVVLVLQGLAVVAGRLLGEVVPDRVLGIASGLLFLAFAAWSWRMLGPEDDDTAGGAGPTPSLAGLLTAMFVAELGDKSNLATAALATRADPIATWLGASAGLFGATLVALVAGSWLRTRVGPRTLTQVGAIGFAIAGTVTLIAAAIAG